jgi:ferric-dicitrate binding protein FerR (iron transport regulator)
VAAIIAVAIFGVRARSGSNVEPPGGVVVHAAAGAVWSKHSEGHREKIVLEHGDLWIHVDHRQRATVLVVELPDGELEDTGTTFTVSAVDGRTIRVAVEEGSVLLRIHGQPPVAIDRAETWAAERPPPPSASPSPVAATRAPHRDRATSPAPARSTRHVSTESPAVTPHEMDPAVDFRAAVAVLDAGAYREAAAAFARFLVAHPRDTRAEDAAYLHIIALQRCGAGDEMRRAIEQYLRLYPAGFRRGEVETLSP